MLRPGRRGRDPAPERAPVHLPAAAARPRYLCLADFFRDRALALARPDVVAFHLVTMGAAVAKVTGELFARNAYRDYLELHGLTVQLTEALAEFWHARVRSELGFAARRRRDRRHDPRPGLPRLALLLRLPGLPGPGGPGASWSSCCSRSGSASSCPRSCSCTPSSRPTR